MRRNHEITRVVAEHHGVPFADVGGRVSAEHLVGDCHCDADGELAAARILAEAIVRSGRTVSAHGA